MLECPCLNCVLSQYVFAPVEAISLAFLASMPDYSSAYQPFDPHDGYARNRMGWLLLDAKYCQRWVV